MKNSATSKIQLFVSEC